MKGIRRWGLGLLFVACLATGTAHALLEDDVHVMYPDDDALRFDIDRRTFEQIQTLLRSGYPIAAVLLRGVQLGVPIDYMTNLAVQARAERAREIYETAITLLSSLPGWSCREGGRDYPYYGLYRAEALGAQPRIGEIARRYFEEDLQLKPFPRWLTGDEHARISSAELAPLVDTDQRWYSLIDAKDADALTPRPVFVSLYKDQMDIVVDDNLDLVGDAVRRGDPDVPVVVIYNQVHQQPVSRFEAPTVESVSKRFFEEGIQLTPVPLWEEGDHHFVAQISELKSRFNMPSKKDVGEERWARLEADIAENGFVKPVLITLYEDGERQWIDDADRVAVADAAGFTELPVVMFYHALDRLPCGEAATCTELVCCAARAGEAAQRKDGSSTIDCECSLEPESQSTASSN